MNLPRFADLVPATAAIPAGEAPVALVLCAGWCSSCREFLPAVEALARDNRAARWAWIDVEDAADALPSLDVETFPSLAVVHKGAVRFLGPVAPDVARLARLVEAMAAAAALDGADVSELAALANRLPARA